jgi:hypothetical protein
MSSRFTVDTTYLKIRDVFAFNANTGKVIQIDQVPVIGNEGHIKWKDSLEFISTVNIPTLKNNVLGLLDMIQPGLSTLSTVYFSTTAVFLTSTVQGLGSLTNGHGYISSSKLLYTVDHLGGDYGYISSQTLYECFNRLGNLNTVGPLLHMPGRTFTFPARGYVSTLHPGEYKIYQSSLRFEGTNLVAAPIDTGTNEIATFVTSIDIDGYMPHIIESSKIRIDINTNMSITHAGAAPNIFTTFLTKKDHVLPIGTPVVVNYTATSMSLPYMTFLLKSADLTPTLPNTNVMPLQLKCSTDSPGSITTLLPEVGGIHITLDNTD